MWFKSNYTKFRQWSYKWRAKYFQPILKLLAKLKITPNQITTFRLILVLPIIYFFYQHNLLVVIICYVFFWLLDLFDGSLARYLNVSNDKGGFLDAVVDHFMYSIIILGCIYIQAADTIFLAYNIIIQLFVNLLVNVKNWKKTETNWLIKIRPDVPYFKTIAHVFLFLFFLGYNYLNPVFFLLNFWMTAFCIYFFIKIKQAV